MGVKRVGTKLNHPGRHFDKSILIHFVNTTINSYGWNGGHIGLKLLYVVCVLWSMNNRPRTRLDYQKLHSTGERVLKAEVEDSTSSNSSQAVSPEVDPIDHLSDDLFRLKVDDDYSTDYITPDSSQGEPEVEFST